MTKVFFSYSHKDETLRDELEIQLTMLKREGLIDEWHDRRISAGEEIDPIITTKLDEAEVILLLTSSDFLASEYCWGIEVQRAMERHNEGSATVIPVILRFCEWQRAPFGKLLATPKDGRPVVNWPDRDEAFLDVVRMVREALTKRSSKPVDPPRLNPLPVKSALSSETIRSSNLRVTKHFTEADKDSFLHQAFDYVGKFFDGSLQALAARNVDIAVAYRPIDANRFTAAAYRNGKKESACTVWIGGGRFSFGGMAYRSDDSGATDSINENLTIGTDEQALHLEARMGGFRRGAQDRKLTMQGGAEYLWSVFMEPLQQHRRGP